MTEQPANQILDELGALAPDQRAERLDGVGATEVQLLEMADAIRRIVLGDLDRALIQSEVLCELADRLGLDLARARARTMRAHALSYANEFERALACLDEACAIAAEVGEPGEEARARLAMIQSLARLGRSDEALGAARSALETFETLDEPEWIVKALTNTGVLLRMRDDPRAAVEHFERAAALAAGDHVVCAQIQSNLAEALLDLGEFARAERAFEESIEAFRAADLGRAGAIAEGNLADLLGRQGRLDAALARFESARRFFERDSAAGDLARIEAEQADVLGAVGLVEDAIAAYERAIAHLADSGLAQEHARALAGLGRQLAGRGDERAEETLEEAAALFESVDQPVGAARVLLLRSVLCLDRGEVESARALLARAEGLAAGRVLEGIHVARVGAEIELRAGNTAGALAMLQPAIDASPTLGLPTVHADLFHTRGRIRIAEGRPDLAVEDLRHAVAEIERIRGSFQADRFRAAFQGERLGVYQDAVGAMLTIGTEGAVRDAFETVEKARARSLLDLMRGGIELSEQLAGGAEREGDGRLLGELADERARLNAIYATLDPVLGAPAEGSRREWVSRLRRCEERITSLESRLASSRRLGDLFASPIELDDLQATLSPESAVIEYFACDGRLLVFVVGADRLETRWLGRLDDVEERIEHALFEMRRAVMRGPKVGDAGARRLEGAQRSLRAVHDAVFQPIADLLDGVRSVGVVPYGPLHLLPFGSLFDGERYLLERFDIRRSPSASLLDEARPTDTRVPGRLRPLVVGVPDHASPGIEREARAVASLFEGADLLLGPDASADAFAARAPSADLIHLACHGTFFAENPMAAGLKLHDRWITVRDVFGLRLNGALVTLSGCDTGRATVRSGEELYGLVRGFLAAGASALVTSLWMAHDRTSREMMEMAYAHATSDPNPKRAFLAGLRAAQREQIAKGQHPAFWAPFVVVGDPS